MNVRTTGKNYGCLCHGNNGIGNGITGCPHVVYSRKSLQTRLIAQQHIRGENSRGPSVGQPRKSMLFFCCLRALEQIRAKKLKEGSFFFPLTAPYYNVLFCWENTLVHSISEVGFFILGQAEPSLAPALANERVRRLAEDMKTTTPTTTTYYYHCLCEYAATLR